MKFFKYLLAGTVFGITLSKAEIISWYRIYEMFKFQSFHMYGVIGSAVVLGALYVQLIKKTKMKSVSGELIEIKLLCKLEGLIVIILVIFNLSLRA